LIIFEIGSQFYAWQACILILLFTASYVVGMATTSRQMSVEMGSDEIFFSVLQLELRTYTVSHSTSPFLFFSFSYDSFF
jgi:hypothetical protein